MKDEATEYRKIVLKSAPAVINKCCSKTVLIEEIGDSGIPVSER